METIESMEQYLTIHLQLNCKHYVKIHNETSLIKIYNLWKTGIIFESNDSTELLYIANYIQLYNNNNEMSIKYYLMAIKKNNIHAMHNLGNYYFHHSDYTNAKKYWIMTLNHYQNDVMQFESIYTKRIHHFNYDQSVELIDNGLLGINTVHSNRLNEYLDLTNVYKNNIMKAVNIEAKRFIVKNYNVMILLLVINKFYDVMIYDVMNNVIIKYLFI